MSPVTSVLDSIGEAGHDTDVSSESDRQRYAAVVKALADPKRLCVLEALSVGERSVSDLSREARCMVPNMSQHLAVLRSAGLVTTRRDGNTVFYRLQDPRVLECYRLIQSLAQPAPGSQ
jgi:ArsR family transcriptional regulator